VLTAAAHGRTIAETAIELGVSPATVTNIRSAAFARLGAHNVTGAIEAARARSELAA
jgi:DNA-binding NarL/FixJ family response regulator